jgi:hypothetical protein
MIFSLGMFGIQKDASSAYQLVARLSETDKPRSEQAAVPELAIGIEPMTSPLPRVCSTN